MFFEQLAYPTLIKPYLFLGSVDTLDNSNFLSKVSHVISVMKNPPLLQNIKQLTIPIEDSPDVDITCYFASVFQFIETAKAENPNHVILIHCEKGMSRSASFVLAWLLYNKAQQNISVNYREELAWLTSERSLTSPNVGFTTQLERFAVQLNQQLTAVPERALLSYPA
ncbi:MAG: dual specificity protein phosphatase [Gammaproteobacteria bacterium]|nr:dual specificity protein phosphatase [Gammaproteobacteria bacterium]